MGSDRNAVRKHSYAGLALPAAIAAVALAINAALLGRDGVAAGLRVGAADLLAIGPRIAAAIVLAAVIQVWLPKERIRTWLGKKGGVERLCLAAVLGALTIGGPFTSFPFVAMLASAGVESGMLVSFLTGWSLLGLQRVIVWEWPLLGSEFVVIRMLSCLAMPIVAGLTMRALSRS